jgi:hypothetical protein
MEPQAKFRFKLKRDVLESRRAGSDGRCAHECIVRKVDPVFRRNDAPPMLREGAALRRLQND